MLHSREVEGHFPKWRDVVPTGGSRFVLPRRALLQTVQEVSLVCDAFNKGVRVRLGRKSTRVSARSSEGRASYGDVATDFLGDGDDPVITGFNPAYLSDILSTLPGDLVLVRVHQNRPGKEGEVCHQAAVLHGWPNRRVRWVVMPVSTGVEPNCETLGCNFVEKRCA